MEKIKSTFKLLVDFNLNIFWIRYFFYLLIFFVAFFIFMNVGGDILYWKIFARLKKVKIRLLTKKRGISFSEGSEGSEQTKDEDIVFSGSPGNFLSIYFAIKSSLKLIAKNFGKEFEDEDKLIYFLMKKNILTRQGKKKLKNIDWVAGMIHNGKIKHIEKILMDEAIKLVWSFHREINVWMRKSINK